MSRYASNTSVSVSNSKAEIERILERYGAEQFMSGWTADRAVVGFSMEGRRKGAGGGVPHHAIDA